MHANQIRRAALVKTLHVPPVIGDFEIAGDDGK
jgi:hypothetical protein